MSNDSSWKQAAQFLTLVDQKEVPKEQVQKIYASGLLSDLLEANVGQVDRSEFRRLLGLGPLFNTDRHGRVLITVTGLGLTGEEWVARMESNQFRVSKWARDILSRSDYNEKHRLEVGVKYTVALVLGKEISRDTERTTADIRQVGSRDYGASEALRGELAMLLREAISDEQLERWGIWYIAVLHEPIVDSSGDLNVLDVRRDGLGQWLFTHCGRAEYEWSQSGAFAFISP
jgi:hypothetical protein